ncbi:MAG: hypothetical protein WCV84_01380 [Patescibacteria group bacterium]
MKRTFLFLGTLLFAGSLALPAHAAPVSGDLIKASGPTVYYYGADGNRYTFPTEKTYKSWYADFSTVKTITDAELATYALRGNVTYKPGVRLLKITTDPKVYAVAQNGTLRWVQTEALALALYGTDWAKFVDDLPDPFFVNYNVGAPIAVPADFAPLTAQQQATSINVDKSIGTVPHTTPVTPPVTPTPTSTTPTTPTVTTTAAVLILTSNLTPRAGEMVTLTARAQNLEDFISTTIWFNGQMQTQCLSLPCVVNVTIPTGNTSSSYSARADFAWDSTTASATTVMTVAQGSSTISLSARAELRSGAQRDVIVSIRSPYVAGLINVYLDNTLVKVCTTVQECRYVATETSATGTTHSLYATATNEAGNEPVRTDTMTYTVVDNDHPKITFLYAQNDILRGETTEVTVNAADDDGVGSTSLWLDGVALKTCSLPFCTVIVGPYSSPRTLNLLGKATDLLGLSNETPALPVYVH